MIDIKDVNIRNSSRVIVRSAEEKDLVAIEHLTAENNEKFDGDIKNMFVAEKDWEGCWLCFL